MSIASELIKVNNTKKAIKAAIIEKGVSVSDSDTFASYANKVNNIIVGGGDTPEELAVLKNLIERAPITELTLNQTKISGFAVSHFSSLEKIILPNATLLDSFSLYFNTKLRIVDIPNVTKLNGNVFRGCTNLSSLYLPKVTTIVGGNFGTFRDCSSLKAIILSANQVCSLDKAPFSGTPIASGTGYIYVPSTLVDSYKAASIWSTVASQIVPIEYYTLTINNNVSGATYNYEFNGKILEDAGNSLTNIISNSTYPINLKYTITKENYATVKGNIDITQNTTLNVTMHIPDWTTFTQPILSANGTLGGDTFAVYAPSAPSSYPAWKAFDASSNSTYCRLSGNELIMYNPNPLKITGLTLIYSSSTYSEYPTISLYSSNDNDTWNKINDYTVSKAASHTLTINNNTGYNYYKLTFTRGSSVRLKHLAITGTEFA